MLTNNVETRALVPSRRAFIKAAPAAAALAATGATVALPAVAGVNGFDELWHAFLDAERLDTDLYFAAEDGDATQVEADAAHEAKSQNAPASGDHHSAVQP